MKTMFECENIVVKRLKLTQTNYFQYLRKMHMYIRTMHCQQGVTLTGRNRTGPPRSVGHPTAHAPGGRPARPLAALQTTTTTTTDDRAKQYWRLRVESNRWDI